MGVFTAVAAIGVGVGLFGRSKSRAAPPPPPPPLLNAVSTVYNNILKFKSTSQTNQWHVPRKRRGMFGIVFDDPNLGYDIGSSTSTTVERIPGTPEEEKEREWLAQQAAQSLHRVVELASTAGDKIGEIGKGLVSSLSKIDDATIADLKKVTGDEGGDFIEGLQKDVGFLRAYRESKFNKMMRRYELNMENKLHVEGLGNSSEADEMRRKFIIDAAAARDEATYRELMQEQDLLSSRLKGRLERFAVAEKARDVERGKLRQEAEGKVGEILNPLNYAYKTHEIASKPFEDEKKYAMMANPGAQVVQDKNAALALANSNSQRFPALPSAENPQQAGFLEGLGNTFLDRIKKNTQSRVEGEVKGLGDRVSSWMDELFGRK